MKIKLFTHQLKINLAPSLPKVIAYYKTHNIDVTFDVEETSVLLPNAVVDLFLPCDGKYDTVMYLFNLGDFTLPGSGEGFTFNLSKTLRASYIATDPTEDAIDYTWKIIAHELLHSIVYKIEDDESVTIPNLLDNSSPTPYYLNDQPDAPGGNFLQQWGAINPEYLVPFQSQKTVTITREPDDGIQTIGKLVVDNFICFTLERPWKNNASNISCIPKGTYQVKYTFSFKFLKYTYEIQNVPNRTGIRIHSANYYSQLLGCIALGSGLQDINSDGEKDVINSRTTVSSFETICGKNPFTLVIQ